MQSLKESHFDLSQQKNILLYYASLHSFVRELSLSLSCSLNFLAFMNLNIEYNYMQI